MVRKHKHREHAYAPSLRGGVELLLAENVESLGKQGDIVRVKPGFARNYLLPQGYATVATEENKLMVEKHREQLKEFAVKQKNEAKKLAEQVGRYSATIEANANKEGHLYGSIVAIDISKNLVAAGYAVEEEHIRLEGPIKELGMYTVKLQVHSEVESEVKVWVVPTAAQ